MNGNFFGGVLKGALAVDQQLNEAEELELRKKQQAIEREKADREQYAFQKQKDHYSEMEAIDADEQAAQANTEFVQGGDATDALVTQAATEIEKNTGAPVGAEQRAQLQTAYSPERNAVNLPGLAKEGALATARNNLIAQGASAAPGTDLLTASQREIIGNAYGVKPDGVTKLDMAMRRARSYQKLGDFKTASEIKKAAETDAAGEFVNAVLNRDANTMFGLYQNYPGGRGVRHIGFDGENVVFSNGKGEVRAVPQYDVIASALARMDPEKAAAMVTAKMREEGMEDRLLATLEQKDRTAWNAITGKLVELDAKLDAGYYNRTGGKAGGSGSTRSRSGQTDSVTFEDARKMFLEEFPDEQKHLSSVAASAYMNMLENQPAYAQSEGGKSELFTLAGRYARGEQGVGLTPEVNADGSWKYSIGSRNGRQYTFQDNIDPLSPKKDGKPMLTPAGVLATLKQTFGPQYDSAAKAATPDGIKKLQAYLRSPNVSAADRAQAQRDLNIALQIQKYSPAAQAAAASAPNAPAAPEFTPAELESLKRQNVTPTPTMGERVSGAWNGIKNAVTDISDATKISNFDKNLKAWRSGSKDEITAGNLQRLAIQYPQLLKKLSADEQARIHAITREPWNQ